MRIEKSVAPIGFAPFGIKFRKGCVLKYFRLIHCDDNFLSAARNRVSEARRRRELTPEQLKAVELAKKQIIKARNIRIAKEKMRRLRLTAYRDKSGSIVVGRTNSDVTTSLLRSDGTIAIRKIQGAVLRVLRVKKGRTLREISRTAGISLGYLSEVERGQKEASSELLASIARALGVRLSDMLVFVAGHVRELEEISSVGK